MERAFIYNKQRADEAGSHECGVSRLIVSPLHAVRIWEISLGRPSYLSPKGRRDHSMMGKRQAVEGVEAAVPLWGEAEGKGLLTQHLACGLLHQHHMGCSRRTRIS